MGVGYMGVGSGDRFEVNPKDYWYYSQFLTVVK